MSQAPKVSVYITNHNYGRFIQQSIDSVLGQSFQDFELIIIDDGSTDDSREIIGRYIGNPRIIPIFQQNRGLNITNNIALHAARGEYIMRLDADDYLHSNALEVMAGALDREPETGLVFPDYYHVDADGQIIEMVRRHDFDEVSLLDQPAHGACTMIRRRFLLDLGGYDESLRCQDGYDLWVRFVEHHRVANVNLPLFYYRQHGTSLTRNEQRILDARASIVRRRSALKGEAPSVLAVIPVRGSLLDPSSLALNDLGGRPLIDWTIGAALNAVHVDHVVVTTPDPQVIDYVRTRYGDAVSVIQRDLSLAMPNTLVEQTLIDAVTRHSESHAVPDAVVMLAVEAPFRTGAHIDTAVEVMVLFDSHSVIGVKVENDLFFQHNGHGLVALRANSRLRLERDDVYRQAGGIELVRTEVLQSKRSLVGERVGHVVMDQRAALFIRSEWDWRVAELIVQEGAVPGGRPVAGALEKTA